ncbi:MAG: sulfurtransferase [Candidatus Zixiibacteriota bacterium]
MHQIVMLAAVCAGILTGGSEAVIGSTPAITATPAWLADHLRDSDVVVLHVASLRDDYTRAHIPGARFLWPAWLAVSTPELGYEMPSVDSLAAVLRTLGVSNESRIVLCHVLGDVTGTARVFVTLDYLGMGDRTMILDGGLAAWQEAGLPVTSDDAEYAPGTFVPKVRQKTVVHLDSMRVCYNSPGVQVVDARSPKEFDATASLNVFRGGHIPGAISIPASTVVDSLDCYMPLDSLAARCERAGLKPGHRIIAYCGVGRMACPVYVAAKMLGYDVGLYDGSFQEWSRKEDLPVEISEKK